MLNCLVTLGLKNFIDGDKNIVVTVESCKWKIE